MAVPGPGSLTSSGLGVPLEQKLSCARVAAEAGIVWALPVYSGLGGGAQVSQELKRQCLAQVTAVSLMGGVGRWQPGHWAPVPLDLSACPPAVFELSQCRNASWGPFPATSSCPVQTGPQL